ncbi:MAG TPA: 8-oxoguanine deaminase [Spirochaetales bacterium]|nr:8-oxoguanine deaminase [Spirochaetales bacterium]
MILLKDCFRVLARGGAPRGEGAELSGVDILVDGGRIRRVGPGLAASERLPPGTRVIDASRHVVLPGLVNTHHHFYQTLTRNLPAVQEAKLFDWLVYLYEVWKGLDEEAVYWSSRLAMAELLKTGCTLTTDHHYLYPRSFSGDLPGIQFEAASQLGIRFAPTRGSMSRSRKDGGLPPDSTVQDEDEILAACEAAIRKYHDPAPDAMRKVALAPCSPFSVSEKSMRDAADLARRHGVRLHTHLAETNDEDDFCVKIYGRRPLRLMEDCGFTGSDVWFAHGIFFDDAELDLLARTKTGVAHCPSSNMRLGSGICRVREMLDRGVPVGLAVDGSASNDSSDMLGEARQALLLQRVRYGSGGISAREALSLATEGGARMLGFPEAGRIEEGALADLALFDVMKLEYAGALSDPIAALLFCGCDHRADYVIVNGALAVDGKRLAGADEEEIRLKAGEASRRLLAKAGLPS